MNSYKSLITVAIVAMLAAGCASTQTSPNAPLQVAPEKAVSNIPGWYLNPPESTAEEVYVVGTSTSRDLAMSVQKAQLDAETHLANKIAGEINTLTKDYKREVGDEFTQSTEIVSNKIAADVKIIGGITLKKQVTPEGGGFRTYVLIRFPLGSNNRMLQNYQAKKSFTGSQEKAEAELERKTEARKVGPQAKVSTAPVVDTSNPYLVVTVTPAADQAEEN